MYMCMYVSLLQVHHHDDLVKYIASQSCILPLCNTTQESRKLVEETLLGVKGVISFTFNMAQRRCIVRTRTDLKPEVPCRALEDTRSLSVKHIVKNENGEEVGYTTCS